MNADVVTLEHKQFFGRIIFLLDLIRLGEYTCGYMRVLCTVVELVLTQKKKCDLTATFYEDIQKFIHLLTSGQLL